MLKLSNLSYFYYIGNYLGANGGARKYFWGKCPLKASPLGKLQSLSTFKVRRTSTLSGCQGENDFRGAPFDFWGDMEVGVG